MQSLKYSGEEKFSYLYNNTGNLYQKTDLINNQTIQYLYDFINRPTQVKNSNGLALNFNYDSLNRLSDYTSVLNGVSTKTGYIYGNPVVSSSQKPGLIYGVKLNNSDELYYSYDSLSRKRYRGMGSEMFGTNYAYMPGAYANSTTTMLESITNYGYDFPSNKISYTYDVKGNISTISENGVLKANYFYDNLSQLIRENNVYTNKTITYSYNKGGNITEKIEYAYTTQSDLSGLTPTLVVPYAYTDPLWKDKLTNYNGTDITYDAIGNPTTIGPWLLAWENGRQLKSTLKNSVNSTYKYDDSGIRTQKTVGSVTTNYFLSGDRVEVESNGTDTLRYFYDENSELIGFNLTNATYPSGSNFYYVRNGQNDIIRILTADSNLAVTYLYDSWGKLISTTGTLATTVGVINPYRYRGYRYDVETVLYYVTSRYYNPETCRMLNADSVVADIGSVQGYNLFSYCMNNPVMMSDPSGHWPKWLTGALTVISGLSQVIAGAALGATLGWTGLGAVAAGFLVINGIATAASGTAQIINDVAGTSIHEENLLRTTSKKIGELIGGNTGQKIAATVYDTADTVASLYSIVGGGTAALSKTASALGKTAKITQQTFSMAKYSKFFNSYTVDAGGIAIKCIQLPKTWFKVVNGIGAGVDTGKKIHDGLVAIFGGNG